MNRANSAGLGLLLLTGAALYGQGNALERLQRQIDAAQKKARQKVEQAQKKVGAVQQKVQQVTPAPQPSPSPPAAVPASVETSISGVYTGYYICAQGYTPLKLIITAHPDGVLEGAFAFEPPGGVPGGGKGSAYGLKGLYTATTGEFQLNPDRWLMRAPVGYQMAGIRGTYNSQTAALRGSVVAPDCKSLEVKKDGPLSAQLQSQTAANLDDMQNLPPGVIATGRPPQTCTGFMSWTTRTAQEYPGVDLSRMEMSVLMGRAANLFEDQHFTRFFGKPFDQISPEERSRLWMEVIRPCLGNATFGRAATWQTGLQYAFLPGVSQAQLLGEVIERRRLRQELPQVLQQAKAVPESVAGWEQAKLLQNQAKQFSVLWPSEFRPLEEAIAAARSRAAVATFEIRLQTALDSARSPEDIPSLQKFPEQHVELIKAAGVEASARCKQQIAAKSTAIITQALAEERSRMQSLPSGLEGLERGATWYNEFTTRFRDPATPGVRALTDEFFNKRKRTLADAEPQLRKLLEEANGNDLAILNRYLPFSTDKELGFMVKFEAGKRASHSAIEPAEPTPELKLEPKEHPGLTSNGLTADALKTDASMRNRALFLALYEGNPVNVAYDRTERPFTALIGQYIMAFAKQCEQYLPSNKAELERPVCNAWEYSTNLFGVRTGPDFCTHYRYEPTGLYVDPALFSANVKLDFASRQMGWNDNHALIDNTPQAKTDADAMPQEVRHLLQLNACVSPAMKRFQENIVHYALDQSMIPLNPDPYFGHLISDPETEPEPIQKEIADYTNSAVDAHYRLPNDTYELTVVVNDVGVPIRAERSTLLPYGLDYKAREAALQWRFKPAMKDGRAVAARTRIKVIFYDPRRPLPRSAYEVRH